MQKLKLLYVDDEEVNLINFRIAFKQHYQVLIAGSAQEGLELFREDPEIALVVADQRMPGMTGVTMLSSMREINPDAVRIILTAYTEVADLMEAINKGRIYHYVVKPWNENELLQILKKAGESYLLTRENKRLIEELGKRNDELAKELARRAEMEKDLADKQAQLAHAGRLSAMGEMASGMAHEINQPLTVINMCADICTAFFAKHVPEIPEFEAVEDIRVQVAKIDNIIRNMRAFSRKSPGELEVVDLSAPLEEALTFFREKFFVHSIRLDEQIEGNLPLVRSDSQKFQQIVVNFLSNAFFAVEEMGRSRPEVVKEIGIRLSPGTGGAFGHHLNLEIRDNGIGMDENTRKRCLEPFFTTKEIGEGTGLGLSVSNSIARELGLRIEVESEQGKGSRFRLLIPVEEVDHE